MPPLFSASAARFVRLARRFGIIPLVLVGCLAARPAYAQQNVGIGTTTPDAKAALDISATDKGLLIPRLTQAQRTAITTPPDGLMVFQTDGTTGFWYYFGGAWVSIPNANTAGDNLGNHTATQNLNLAGNKLVGNGGTTGISISSAGAVTTDGALTTGTTLTTGGVITAGGNVQLGTNQLLGNGGTAGLTMSSAGSAILNTEGTGFIVDAATTTPRVGLMKYSGREGGIWRTSTTKFEIGRLNTSSLLTAPSTYTVDLVVSGSGLTGINTTDPMAKLDIQGGADATGTSDPRALAFQHRNGGYRHWVRTRHNSSVTGAGNALDFYLNNSSSSGGSSAPGTNNVQVLTLESNNGSPRVGIGTTAPSATLHVSGSTSTVRFDGLAGTGTRVVTTSSTGDLSTVTTASLADNLGNHTATTNLNLGANRLVGNSGSSGLYLTNAGQVAVGSITSTGGSAQLANTTTNTLGADTQGGGISGGVGSLNWAMSTNGYTGLIYNGSSAANGNGLAVKVDGTNGSATVLDVSKGAQATAGTSLLMVKASGNVGIGTTNPTVALDVVGSAKVSGTATAQTFALPTSNANDDVGPIITSRVIPTTQGNVQTLPANQGRPTELILFHSNDGNTNNGGPDQITLRAPQLNFQTYNNTTVNGIADDNGYNERLKIDPDGVVKISSLAGTGTRMVTADATGNLSTQTVPVDTDAQQLSISGGTISLTNGGAVTVPDASATNELQTISKTGSTVTLSNGGGSFTDADTDAQTLSISGSTITISGSASSVTVPSSADNLGNHTATQDLDLGANQLVGNGGTSGLSISSAGKVGIGTTAPAATLHVAGGDAAFTATGDVPASPAPLGLSGAGRRAFWYADKAAFRAGYVTGTQWDQASIGNYSTAFGYNNTAGGEAAFAGGYSATASGDRSLSFNGTASGFGATAIGSGAQATNDDALALGPSSTASGLASICLGPSQATASFAVAIGLQNNAYGNFSTAMGKNAKTLHKGAFVLGDASAGFSGDSITSSADNQFVAAFAGGYRFLTSRDPKVYSFVITRTGNVGVGTASPSATLEVSGATSTVKLAGLAGSGTRMVTADASGNLSTAAVPVDTDAQILSISGSTLSISGGNNVTLPTYTSESTTASNGLTLSGTDVRLGGALTSATTIGTTAANPLTVNGAGAVSIGTGTGATSLGNSSAATTITGSSIGLTGAVTSANALTVSSGGLTVSAGGASVTGTTSLTGTTSINSSGTATTSIGTGAAAGTVTIGRASGTVTMANLTGSGTRVVTADASGDLSTVTTASLGDNLGNHTATQKLDLSTFKLVGNGGTTGLAISSAGVITTDGQVNAGGNINLGTNRLVGNGGTNGLYLTSTGQALWGTITSGSGQLTNSTANTLGTDGNGVNVSSGVGSLNWAMSTNGYAGAFYNGSSLSNGNGLAVKVDGTNAAAVVLDVSKGAQATAGTSLLMVKASGNVGIGTSSPSTTLDVNGGFKLGSSGTALAAVVKATVSKDLPSIGSNSTSTQTFTVTNAAVGASVIVSPANALTDGLVMQYARVSAANTVEVKFYNRSTGSIDEVVQNFYITVIQ